MWKKELLPLIFWQNHATKETDKQPQDQLFQVCLVVVCDPIYSLVKLANQIGGNSLNELIASLYAVASGPANTPPRMMIGLTLLQSLYSLSEEYVVTRCPENPCWHYLRGETFFQHQPPTTRSGPSKWRKQIKSKGVEALLQQTLAVGLAAAAGKNTSLRRFSVDTTM